MTGRRITVIGSGVPPLTRRPGPALFGRTSTVPASRKASALYAAPLKSRISAGHAARRVRTEAASPL